MFLLEVHTFPSTSSTLAPHITCAYMQAHLANKPIVYWENVMLLSITNLKTIMATTHRQLMNNKNPALKIPVNDEDELIEPNTDQWYGVINSKTP